MTKPITWLIDEILLEKHDDMGFPTMAEAAREAGHHVFVTKYVPFSQELVLADDAVSHIFHNSYRVPLVVYGTVQFCRQFKRTTWLQRECPGAFLREDQLKFSTCAAYWTANMLNDDFFMLPYGELRRRINEDLNDGLIPQHYEDFYDGEGMFLRPDVVTKSFAGRVFHFDTEEDNIEALDRYEKISPEEMCVISRVKEIISETRHVIVNGNVVAESQYRRNNVLDIRIDVPHDHHDMADKWIAKRMNDQNWEPDTVYVVDIAETVDGPRIIEFNSFSCSGLYACDTRAIVDAVSEQAWKELTGDLD